MQYSNAPEHCLCRCFKIVSRLPLLRCSGLEWNRKKNSFRNLTLNSVLGKHLRVLLFREFNLLVEERKKKKFFFVYSRILWLFAIYIYYRNMTGWTEFLSHETWNEIFKYFKQKKCLATSTINYSCKKL